MSALPPGGLRNIKWRHLADAIRAFVIAARHSRKDLGAATVIGRERERKRIASELHDGLGQALTLIKLTVEDARIRLRAGRTDEAHELLDTAVTRICEAMGDVRQICNEMHPVLLDRLGLVASLASICRRIDEHTENVCVRLDCRLQDSDVPDELRADIFRVAQETLTNTLKHGSARTISVRLHRAGGGLLLSIEDDGVGFDAHGAAADPAFDGGLGLAGMRRRVEAAGGTFAIHSSEMRGTVVSAFWAM